MDETLSSSENRVDLELDQYLAAHGPAQRALIAGLSPAKRALFLKRLSGAAETERKLGAGEGRRVAALAPAVRDGDVPLSFAQQRLWFLDRLLPDKAAYNVASAWRLR